MIIAFSGQRGVGKTLAAKYLERKYGMTHVSFAGKLKELAAKMFPFEDFHFSPSGKELPFVPYEWSPRAFLIAFGTFLRYWDALYFVKVLDRGAQLNNAVIDDLRFVNEAEFLVAKGAKLVRINRYASQNPYKGDINDPSEHDLDNYKNWSYVIPDVFNTSPEELYKALDGMMRKFND